MLTTRRHLTSIPSTFHCDIPTALADDVAAAPNDDAVRQIGVEWATEQSRALLEAGVPSVHYYVMGNSRAINALIPRLGL